MEKATATSIKATEATQAVMDPPPHPVSLPTAFGCPRDFMGRRFVYTVVSPRARGLSIGVNLCPDHNCNFDCLYCEVNRSTPAVDGKLDVNVMVSELRETLAFVAQGRLQERPEYRTLPEDLLRLRHVTLSGDGEPTLAPNFVEIVQAVVHVRALGEFPKFKIVLVTNASGLDLPNVREGLKCLTRSDEIWAKLDAGTQEYLERIAQPKEVTLEKILSNILLVARQRPVVIQSLFPTIDGQEPPMTEIGQYARRLKELKKAGAQISLVQIYSATRPMFNARCGHLPLKNLSQIARLVRSETGLHVEVY